MNWKIKSIVLIYSVCLFFTSCNSVPDGAAPEGPIINNVQEIQNKLSKKNALEYMITRLSMKCPYIAYKSHPPKVANEFLADTSELNSLQIDLWRALTKMNLIIPMIASEKPDYIVSSSFMEIDKEQKKYIWIVLVSESDNPTGRWEDRVEFNLD